MKKSERKNITDIVYAFREINKDIRNSFDIMKAQLESKEDFNVWKKWKKSITPTVEGYRDFTEFLTDRTDNWYYLNCYGLYRKKVVGFTFIISLEYDEKTDTRYCEFMNKLDRDVNKNTPMLCIAGVYTLIDDSKNISFLSEGYIYPDDTIQLTGDWKNYDIDKIAYDKWMDVDMEYEEDGELKEGYDGWYKKASVKFINITNISSKKFAHDIIDDLVKKSKTDIKLSTN